MLLLPSGTAELSQHCKNSSDLIDGLMPLKVPASTEADQKQKGESALL